MERIPRRIGTYGTKRIRAEMAEQGIVVGLNRSRRHAKIGNKVPAEFANQYYAIRQRPAA